MENQNVKFRLIGMMIGLTAMTITFINYPFWDAVVIVYFQNAIIGLVAIIGGYLMIVVQIGFWLFIKMLIYPAFIGSCYSEITPRLFVYSILIFGIFNCISVTIQWSIIQDLFQFFRCSIRKYKYARESKNSRSTGSNCIGN